MALAAWRRLANFTNFKVLSPAISAIFEDYEYELQQV